MSNLFILLLLFMRVANTASTAVNAESINRPYTPLDPQRPRLNQLAAGIHAINESSVGFYHANPHEPERIFQQLLNRIDDSPSSLHFSHDWALQSGNLLSDTNTTYHLLTEANPRVLELEQWSPLTYDETIREDEQDTGLDELAFSDEPEQTHKKKFKRRNGFCLNQ